MSDIFGWGEWTEEPGYVANDAPTGSLNDWGSWSRNVAGSVITGALDMYKLRTISGNGGVPAVGADGRVYTEGQRTTGLKIGAGGLQISPVYLLAGAALVAFLVLKK